MRTELAVVCLFTLLLLTSGMHAAEELDASKTPIASSGFPDGAAPGDLFFAKIEKGGEQTDMTAGEIETYISSRLKNGEPVTESWIDSCNLFRACLILAANKKEAGQEYKQWLEIALSAANACFAYDSNEIQLSMTMRIHEADDAWFCDRMIDMCQGAPVESDEEKAFALCNIGSILMIKEDNALAEQAFAAAHQLFPDDSLVSLDLQWCQDKLGDYEAALKTLKNIDFALEEESSIDLSMRQMQNTKAGELHMKLGQNQEAQNDFLAAWKIMCERERRDSESFGIGADRNRIATALGLLALERGDRSDAIHWFEESFARGGDFPLYGYDLRLVKELMRDPALRELCISYLQLALEAKRTKTEDEVKALLAQLTGDQTAAKVRGAAPSGKADETAPDGMTSQKANPQQTQAEQAGPQNSQKNLKTTVAVVAVIIAAVLATIYANRRKKAKGEKHDI
ncbi:MAG: hypothetical protein JW759_06885 [Candidatus Coatesbacteria bacterium]|nr:hypothetical protein [Candidatus Coatesbacteria bacterium]